MTKKLIYILLAVIAFGGGGAYAYLESRPKTTPIISKPPTITFGTTTSCYSTDKFTTETADKQIAIIKDLGSSSVRLTLERSIISTVPFKVVYDDSCNDYFINKLTDDGIDVVLVIGGDIIRSTEIPNFDQRQAGYEMANYAVNRYKGKVKYYQIDNEVTGTTVKPTGYTGETFKDEFGVEYSLERYNAVKNWTLGMSQAIRTGDPTAKIVLTGHWILFNIIQKLQTDGVNFDIVGWAWYSNDGTDITKREYNYGSYMNLAEKLSQFGKPVWIIELNQDKGSYDEAKGKIDETQQANFLNTFIPAAVKTGLVKGIFVFPLFDTPAFAAPIDFKDANWGIVKIRNGLNNKPIFEYKRAFSAYKNLIQKYQYFPASS